MTFALPTANNLHDQDPDATPGNLRHLVNITEGVGGGITAISAKAQGNLPISQAAGQFRNNGTSGTSIAGLGYEFQASQAAYDVSGQTKLILWHNQFNAPNRIQVDTVANGGIRLRIYSGTGSMPTNYKEYYLGGRDTPFGECCKGQYPFIVDLNDTSQEATSGTFDNTDVTSYAFLILRNNMAGTNDAWAYMSSLFVIDTTKTSSSTPTFTGTSSFQDAVDAIQGSDYTDKYGNWVRQIGDVVFIDMPFRIGDNSTETDFDDEGLTIISPKHDDSADPRVRVTTQAFRTYLNLRNNSADTAVFSGTWIWQVRSPFDWDQDDAAAVTFDSPTFKGMGEFTVGSSITGPAIFDDVDAVVAADSGVDLDGSVFRNQNGDHALELAVGMDIADMRFESYSGKHAIKIENNGTYNFSNCFFDQSGTNDIEMTADLGVVVINVTDGGTVPTVTETGSSGVTVNNNVTLTVHVTDTSAVDIQNARVRLVADETVGSITSGDVILTGLTNSSGIVETTTFNYEAAFEPSGLACLLTVRQGSVSPYKKPLEDKAATITAVGFNTTEQLVSDE